MVERKLKTTEGTITVKIPTTLDELTIGQFILMSNPGLTDIEIVSLLSYVPVDELYKVRNIDDIQVFKAPILSLCYNIEYTYDSTKLPKHVVLKTDIGEKKIRIPGNLQIEPVGAYMSAYNIIADEQNKAIKEFGPDGWKENFRPSPDAALRVLAHYLYSRVYGEYNEGKAEEFSDVVKYLSMADACPIAAFFFSRFPNLNAPKITYLKAARILLRNRRALKGLKSSGT